MLCEYIDAALARATYDVIQDEEPFYGEVQELKGVWATGRTLEACRRNLAEAIEGWVLIRLTRNLPVPPLDEITVIPPREMNVA